MEKQIQVKCIKNVVMNGDGYTAFIKGKTYNAVQEESGKIRGENESGNHYHWINSSSNVGLTDFFKGHFEIVYEVEKNSNLPESVRKLLEEEKAYLEGHIKGVEERLNHRRKQLEYDEKSLEKGKEDLANIIKVLEG